MQNLMMKQELNSQDLHMLATEMDKKKKSTGATWLFWFFLGGIGGHRYYLGRTGSAIAMTLTLGCLGLWTLIDLFLISGMIRKTNEKIERDIITDITLLKNARNNAASTAAV
ncbi:TM2 domain-containing protein [Cohnella luojiensis]|uniref:TM2 domain-containing protein n=1 Tax=Cohnella luojiensis TaxID=652876 RepID=A0A4Y8LT15_9BACL|nr:TM2 domain-containing protein [Cohnella luojiensis]TFE23521.1 TM2 domain-containing protein [Cohnella luojiensis]